MALIFSSTLGIYGDAECSTYFKGQCDNKVDRCIPVLAIKLSKTTSSDIVILDNIYDIDPQKLKQQDMVEYLALRMPGETNFWLIINLFFFGPMRVGRVPQFVAKYGCALFAQLSDGVT